MKTTTLLALFLTASVAFGGDITPGLSIGTGANQIQDGQRLTSAKQLKLVSDAVIEPAFYTGKVSQSNLAGGDVLLVISASSGTFHKVSGNGAFLQNPQLISGQSEYTTLEGYDAFLLYDPTNGVMGKVTFTNLGGAIAPFIVVSNLTLADTNGNRLPVWSVPFTAGQTNNQPFSLWWGTNGQPRAVALSNLLSASAPDFGTNLLTPYVWAQVFNPAAFISPATNAATNVWGYTNVFPITNLTVSATNIPTLGSSNTIPVYVQGQGSNTTMTVGALYQYMTNQNALPTYTLARATFSGAVASKVLSNAVDTTADYVYSVHGLATGDAVSMVNSVGPASLPAATPALTTNQVYWVSNVTASTLMLFTNRDDCLAGTNWINITGVGANTSTLLVVSNHSSVNADVTAVTTGTTKSPGLYDVWFRSTTVSSNYYVLGTAKTATGPFSGFLAIPDGYFPETNRCRVEFRRNYYGDGYEFPRVQVSIQPE